MKIRPEFFGQMCAVAGYVAAVCTPALHCSSVWGSSLCVLSSQCTTAVNVDPACSQQLSSIAKVARRPTGELRKKELMPHSTTNLVKH